jgi:hypothetical protein
VSEKITQTIADAGADYVIQVKDNQKNCTKTSAFSSKSLKMVPSIFSKFWMERTAANLLKRENSLKAGLQTKRLKAAWGHDDLMKVLAIRK